MNLRVETFPLIVQLKAIKNLKTNKPRVITDLQRKIMGYKNV